MAVNTERSTPTHTHPYATDPHDLFLSSSVAEALARIEYSVANHYRVVVLAGPSGSGKSALLRHAAATLDAPQRQLVRMSMLGMQQREFLTELAVQLGEPQATHQNVAWIWRRLQDHFKLNTFQQIHTTLLFDDATQTTDDVRQDLLRLAQIDPHTTSLSIVVAVPHDQLPRLGEGLLDLCHLRIELTEWEEDETGEFLKQAARAVGADPSLFDPPTTRTLHGLAHGNPRRIRQLAELALIAAAGAEDARLDAELVHSVHRELVWS